MLTTVIEQRLRDDILRTARGSQQRAFVRSLLAGTPTHALSYGVRGRASSYRARYDASTANIVARIRALDSKYAEYNFAIAVLESPGPRGGRYARTYELAILDMAEPCSVFTPDSFAAVS